MPEYVATLLAALIGAVIGSAGAVWVEYILTQRAERNRRRERIVERYLFQLQDAVEALWHRLNNVTSRGGRDVMSDDYFELTTLYALGRLLAVERILALEGVYSQLDATHPQLAAFLMRHRIDREFQGFGFYQYDRITLAEATMERDGDQYRASTYLEFRHRYEVEESSEKEWLAPARQAIQTMDERRLSILLHALHEVAVRLPQATKVTSSLPGEPSESG